MSVVAQLPAVLGRIAGMTPGLSLLKYSALAGALLLGAVIAHSAIARPTSAANRALSSYTHYLERRMKTMFMPGSARAVIIAQAASIYGIIAASIAVHEPSMMAFAILIAVLPAAVLELKFRKRVSQIEDQTDTFILALANALKATPSVADAFISLVPIIAEPLKSEVDLAVKQMRLGCTLEDALVLLAGRIGSRAFDTALASVLIGQRVGGNLPRILETSAGALRELNRLESMVKSKTASGRIQLWVIAIAPLAFVIFFERTQPGWFQPLTTSFNGQIILGAAILCWVVAVVLGRKILTVDV